MTQKRITVLVSGSTGQLGQELQAIATQFPRLKFTFQNRSSLDLSSKASIKTNLEKSYDFFVNAGAYTAVDKAEHDQKTAEKINTTALGHIARYAPAQTKVIHISSDYVYHLKLDRPLKESDTTQPKGVYAKTKLKGEQLLLDKRPDSIVLRTSWVYSSFGNNFVKTMQKLGASRNELTIVADQHGAPTYARDLASAICHMILNQKLHNLSDLSKSGIFNYSNMGLTNWADFAREIFKQSNIKCGVTNTTTKAYNAPAPRPLWSMLSKVKIQESYHLHIPYWKESLSRCLQELKK